MRRLPDEHDTEELPSARDAKVGTTAHMGISHVETTSAENHRQQQLNRKQAHHASHPCRTSEASPQR
jgi:hypothetical protein